VLGRGKAHRVGHRCHRAEAAGLQPLPGLGHGLAPAYDLVATALVNPADTEELTLTLNGKKEKLRPEDFLAAAQRAGVDEKVMTGVFSRFVRVRPAWEKLLAESFLPPELKEGYLAPLQRKFKQMGLA
jgi:serine/threonine-protein kinase HipA